MCASDSHLEPEESLFLHSGRGTIKTLSKKAIHLLDLESQWTKIRIKDFAEQDLQLGELRFGNLESEGLHPIRHNKFPHLFNNRR